MIKSVFSIFDKPARMMLCIPSLSDHSPSSLLNSPMFISIPELQRAEETLNFKVMCPASKCQGRVYSLFSLVNYPRVSAVVLITGLHFFLPRCVTLTHAVLYR